MNEEKETLTRLCKDCMCIERCIEAFNDFWPEKSRCGLGCRSPLSKENKYLPTANDAKHEKIVVVSTPPPPPYKKEEYQLSDLFSSPLPLTEDDI